MKEGEVYYVDKENKDTLMQMQKLEEYDAFFHDLFHNSKIKELAANALGEDVIPRAMEYFNKPPGKSNPTPPHQDGYYFNLDNDKAVTVGLPLKMLMMKMDVSIMLKVHINMKDTDHMANQKF